MTMDKDKDKESLAEQVYEELVSQIVESGDGTVLLGLLEYLEKNDPKILRETLPEEGA